MEDDEQQRGDARSLEELIAEFARHEPPMESLGTPFITDTDTTRAIVRRGSAAVPALKAALRDTNSRIVMYAAYCLGLIGDPTVQSALRETREGYQAREPKQGLDFAVISSTSQALARLRR